MGQQIEKDLSRSARTFRKFIWPTIKKSLGQGKLIDIEGQDCAISLALDYHAGGDYLQLLPDGGLRIISSRVQYGRDWQSFTIRLSRSTGSDTEFSKRKRELELGYLSPYWTCQAYMVRNQVASVGVVNTRDLFALIESKAFYSWTIRETSNASFLVVPFEDVEGVCMSHFYRSVVTG